VTYVLRKFICFINTFYCTITSFKAINISKLMKIAHNSAIKGFKSCKKLLIYNLLQSFFGYLCPSRLFMAFASIYSCKYLILQRKFSRYFNDSHKMQLTTEVKRLYNQVFSSI